MQAVAELSRLMPKGRIVCTADDTTACGPTIPARGFLLRLIHVKSPACSYMLPGEQQDTRRKSKRTAFLPS
jgi:hypothetical protein